MPITGAAFFNGAASGSGGGPYVPPSTWTFNLTVSSYTAPSVWAFNLHN